jgi:hypothetical protein
MPQITGGTDQAGWSSARHWGRFDGTPRGNGKIAAASRRANAMVKDAGLTWDEVLAPAGPIPHQPYRPPRRWRRPVPASDSAALCLQRAEVLTDWEMDFYRSLFAKHRTLPRQTTVLAWIVHKVAAFARASGEGG